jgi:hypothetical protein
MCLKDGHLGVSDQLAFAAVAGPCVAQALPAGFARTSKRISFAGRSGWSSE